MIANKSQTFVIDAKRWRETYLPTYVVNYFIPIDTYLPTYLPTHLPTYEVHYFIPMDTWHRYDFKLINSYLWRPTIRMILS